VHHLEERLLDQALRLVVRQGREEGRRLGVGQGRRQLHPVGVAQGRLWAPLGMAWVHHPNSGRGKLVQRPEPQGLRGFEVWARVQT
jgi:hypothetical protein